MRDAEARRESRVVIRAMLDKVAGFGSMNDLEYYTRCLEFARNLQQSRTSVNRRCDLIDSEHLVDCRQSPREANGL